MSRAEKATWVVLALSGGYLIGVTLVRMLLQKLGVI